MPYSDQELDATMRLRNLSELGAAVEVDDKIPPRRYFRSGMEMIRMANVYMDEENYENAFILYSKFITLFVEKLPHHPDYREALPTDKADIKRKLKEVFPRAEKLKLTLKNRYAKEYDKILVEKKQREEQLAREREQKRREEEEERRKRLERDTDRGQSSLKIQAELEKWTIDSNVERYRGPIAIDGDLFEWPNDDDRTVSAQTSNDGVVPLIPSRQLKPVVETPSDKLYTTIGGIPSIDRSKKPCSVISPGSNAAQSWSSLRNITVPAILMSKFLNLAQNNTDQNIETCGILTGKLAQNRFTITHLLVPKQMGTADSCTTDNEEEIFGFQDQHDLITLGWIHTHPSQTSFMSSVDLHTHCAYQLMLPEAVAIVCSPKYNETGIYSLTKDYGLNFIAKCQLSGFHPHPKEPPLYIDSDHVQVDTMATVSVVDLR